MKALFRFVFILFAALAAGCVTYKEPTEGPTASIRFVALDDGAGVNTFDIDSNYCESNKVTMALLGGGLRPEARKRIGLPLGEEFDDVYVSELKIPASKPFHFSMGNGYQVASTFVSCHVSMRLDPAPGKIYEAQYVWKGRSCRIDVNEIRQNLNGYERTPDRTTRRLPYCIRK